MERMNNQFISQLNKQLQNELPGISAHQKMLPPGRELIPPLGNNSIMQSGVLLLIFQEGKSKKLVLIRRPVTMKNHAGQIAFPGGKMEPQDNGIVETALRESKEEIGIAPEKVRVIGTLSPVYVQVSNFVIHPVVGWYDSQPDFKMEATEVANVHIISIEDMLLPSSLTIHNVETLSGLLSVPGFSIDGLFIWGATAMILTEFLEIYTKINRGK